MISLERLFNLKSITENLILHTEVYFTQESDRTREKTKQHTTSTFSFISKYSPNRMKLRGSKASRGV